MNQLPKRLLQNPSGFPDLGPKEAIAQQRMLDVIRRQFISAGYVPIETPLVERPEVLLAKAGGEISTQMYGLRRLNVSADATDDTKELALRFDHTVPLARFIAANQRELAFPFRRFAIGPVFRGERPKSGRYRQFIQADIDAIGDGDLSPLHDAEMVAVIHGIFSELKIGPFTVRIGNRKVLQAILKDTGLSDDQLGDALRSIDELEKVGADTVITELKGLGLDAKDAKALIELLTDKGDSDAVLKALKARDLGPGYSEGVAELETVVNAVRDLGVPDNRFRIDLSIARGLDYYTGTVYETRLDEHPDLGSIASGGRYDDLASVYVNKQLPGVGISIGVTRLLLRLINAGLWPASESAIAEVLVTTDLGAKAFGNVYLKQAAALRAAGYPTEVYLNEKPLAKQLLYASRRGFKFAVITRNEDIKNGTVIVRNLKDSSQHETTSAQLVETIEKLRKTS